MEYMPAMTLRSRRHYYDEVVTLQKPTMSLNPIGLNYLPKHSALGVVNQQPIAR
jgi:hypothetical protein